jgi:uncharacterized protein YjbI with pentapeptide repeats
MPDLLKQNTKLKQVGFTAKDFKKAKYTLKQLIELGFTTADFSDDGIPFDDTDFQDTDELNADTLNLYGFDAKRIFNIKINSHKYIYALEPKIPHIIDINKYLKSISVSAPDLYNVNKDFVKSNYPSQFSERLLLSILILAGFTYNVIRSELYADNNLIRESIQHIFDSYTMHQYISKTIPHITLNNIGFSASQLKNIGYSAIQLKMGGFTASQLKDAGFTARELIIGQFTIKDLKDADFTASQLKTDGFPVKDLNVKGGFTASQLKDAGFTARELINGKFTIEDLMAAGFTLPDLKKGGLTALELKKGNIPLLELIKLRQIQEGVDGYTDRDKNLTGYTLKELQEAGYDLLTNTDYDLNYIFKNAKYTYGEIKDAHAYYKKSNNDQKSMYSETIYKAYDKKLQDIYTILQADKNEGCKRTEAIFLKWGQETPLNCVYTKL